MRIEQGSSRLIERKRSTLFLGGVAAVLYFSEGLPYGMVKEFAPLYLRVQHVDLKSIGLMNVVGLAWTLKFLWSPLVDTVGTYKRWINAAVLAITISLGAMAAVSAPNMTFYTLLALLALASAT